MCKDKKYEFYMTKKNHLNISSSKNNKCRSIKSYPMIRI